MKAESIKRRISRVQSAIIAAVRKQSEKEQREPDALDILLHEVETGTFVFNWEFDTPEGIYP